jgi:hypothetical protein
VKKTPLWDTLEKTDLFQDPKEVFAMSKYVMKKEPPQAPDWQEEMMAEALGADLLVDLAPLLRRLAEVLDKRVVRTFAQRILAIVRNRDRARCLVQTELGALLEGADKAKAGAKRLRTLLCKLTWKSDWIGQWLMEEAERALHQWEAQGVTPVAAWDGSVLEKHESAEGEGLCPVHSSKAARRTRMRPGYYHPPVGRICVPGLQWLGVVFTSPILTQGHPVLAAMPLWTTRGGHRSWQRDEETRLMRELAARFGRRIIHVFDRGFGGCLWVRVCTQVADVRFIMRWRGKVHLVDEKGQCRPAWKAVVGQRQGQEQRVFWNARAHQLMRLRVAWAQVTHPSHPDQPLFLVVVRGYREAWYLLTNEPISSEQDAWQVALAYLQRWQIEQVWRVDKSEFGFESVRIWAWEDRLKLLSMAMLAHAFLLRLMDSDPLREWVRQWLLQRGCPRSGWHCRLTLLPLSRLRAALCWLWQRRLPAWALPRLRPRIRLPAGMPAGQVLISLEA